MSLTDEMWAQPKPSEEAVHNMCFYVRKIIYVASNGEEERSPCKECEGWKTTEEDGETYRSAKVCYIRAEETLRYAMAILKREGWREPDDQKA
jgi:hypothetical protein